MVNILLSLWTFAEPYIKNEMEKYIKPSNKVAIISLGQNDWYNDRNRYNAKYGLEGKHYLLPVSEFEKLGINRKNIELVHYFEDNPEDMKRKINSSDIIMFTGGMPDKAMVRFKEKDICEDIISFDKVIMGYSAGAILQLNSNFLSPDDDYPELMYTNGLSYISNDFYIEVHYSKEDNWRKLLGEIRNERNKPIYAIGDYGAVIIDECRNIKIFGDVTII